MPEGWLHATKDRQVGRFYYRSCLIKLHGRQRHHQIPLTVEDISHTAFITLTRVYFYMVMPFGLKNTEVTYRRMVNKIFKDQIVPNLEVYVDDMIPKAKEPRITPDTFVRHSRHFAPIESISIPKNVSLGLVAANALVSSLMKEVWKSIRTRYKQSYRWSHQGPSRRYNALSAASPR